MQKCKVIDLNREDRIFMVGSVTFTIISIMLFVLSLIHIFLKVEYPIYIHNAIMFVYFYTWVCLGYCIIFHLVIKKHRIKSFSRTGIDNRLKVRSIIVKMYALGRMKKKSHIFAVREENWPSKQEILSKGYESKLKKMIQEFENLGVYISAKILDGINNAVIINSDEDANLIKLSIPQTQSGLYIKGGGRIGDLYIQYFNSNELLDKIKNNRDTWQDQDVI